MAPTSSTSRFERWLLVGALLPVLVALLGGATLQGLTERELVRESIELEGRTLAHLTASLAEAAVEFEDTRAVDELLEHVTRSKHFAFVAVLRADGTTLASREKTPGTGRWTQVSTDAVVLEDASLVLAVPIGPAQPAPRLVLGLSTLEADQTLRRSLIRGLSLDAIASLVSVIVVLWLVRQLVRRTKNLEMQREMLRQTGRMARVGGWELHLPGGEFHLSDEACAVLSLGREQSIDVMKAMALRHRALVTCIDTGEPFDFELEVQVAGSTRWMRVKAEAERADSVTRRVFGAIQDVTEQRETREAALAASRAKSQFLANTSHEIRTPLNGILGMTELALEGTLTAEQRGYLESARQSGKNMLAIVNDLLDIARIESGRFTIEALPMRLDEVVISASRALVVEAQRKGLELVVTIEPEVPVHRVADPLRVTQIVSNLVGNALKFTSQGEVEVLVAGGASAEEVRLSVRDTGMGIPADRLDAIFDAFTQSDGSTTRRFGGTGLGLTITRELARLMGGDVHVTSTEGEGSTFTATLRLGLVADAPPQRALHARVLVLEGRTSNARATCHTLARLGAEPMVCRTVAEVEGVPRSSFDFVFLDARVDGSPALAARLESEGVAVVLLVPFGTASRRGRTLARPLCIEEVAGALAPSEGAAGGKEEATRPRRKLKVLLAEDNPINAKLACKLVERAGHEVTHVWNGKDAVDAALGGAWDLALMDVQMPELDGLEATRRIRAHETASQSHLTIVAMTANAMDSDQVQCLAAGMDGFLSKPVDLKQLEKVLDDVATREAA